MSTFKHLKKWTYPNNYCGESYFDYYVGFVRTRDSEILEDSNFEVALERLGGEQGEKVIVARSSHWACGWVEVILVHESAKKQLKILNELHRQYKNYSVLDDSDYSEREYEYYQEWARQSCDETADRLSRLFGVKNGKALREIAYELEMQAQFYGGPDSCVNLPHKGPPNASEIDRLKRHLSDAEHQLKHSRRFQGLVRAVDDYKSGPLK